MTEPERQQHRSAKLVCGLELGLKATHVSTEVGGGWLGVDNTLLITPRILDSRVSIRASRTLTSWTASTDWAEKRNSMGMPKLDVKI